jgi:hypothetical protein
VPSDSGAYYCSRCDKHVFQMIHRFVFDFLLTFFCGYSFVFYFSFCRCYLSLGLGLNFM